MNYTQYLPGGEQHRDAASDKRVTYLTKQSRADATELQQKITKGKRNQTHSRKRFTLEAIDNVFLLMKIIKIPH